MLQVVAGTADVWRAMSLENPKSIHLSSDHPTSPVRYVQMRKVAEQIVWKQKHGMPLIPDMKVTGIEEVPPPEPESIFSAEN